MLAEVRVFRRLFQQLMQFQMTYFDLVNEPELTNCSLCGFNAYDYYIIVWFVLKQLYAPLQEFLASAKGWKVKVTTKGRRIYEHRTTGSSCFDLPAAVQNDFQSTSTASKQPKTNKEKPVELTDKTNHKVRITHAAKHVLEQNDI